MVPFLFAAGAMQYPVRKFLAALLVGRIPRYMILAYLAARYGRQIIAFMKVHGHPVVLAIILAVVAAAALVFYFWRGARAKRGRVEEIELSSLRQSNLTSTKSRRHPLTEYEPAAGR